MLNNSKTLLVKVEEVFTALDTYLEPLNAGDRLPIADLTEQIAGEVGMEPKLALGFVSFYVRNSDLVYLSKGKHGGVVRGIKPTKIAK